MSQRDNFLYRILSFPIIYRSIQLLASGISFRKKFVLKNTIKGKKINVLDVGCGPADILEVIPNCNFYGFDIDPSIIRYAKKKYNNKNYKFFCKEFSSRELKRLPKFDLVILFGVIHHLDDIKCTNLLKVLKKTLKVNGKLISCDPVLDDNQNFIARFLIKNDRGKNVRYADHYFELNKKIFKKIECKTYNQNFIPYTWFTSICKI